MKTSILAFLCCASLCISPLTAQGDKQAKNASWQGTRPELALLGNLIDQAVSKVEASVVMVEPFGGYEYKAAKQGKKKPKKKKKGLGPIRPGQFLKGRGASTGLVIDSDGWILTTRFVTRVNPTSIIVTLGDGRKLTAKRMGEDRSRGIALLKVEAKDLPVPEFVSQDGIQVGDWALALGRTFGPKKPTVHAGIVSALRRVDGRAVQTDAYTSPVNYGGPLIDIKGRVMGIVCPLSPKGDVAGTEWYDSGIGFAANLDSMDDVLAGMKEGHIYKKALLGVNIDQSFLGPGARIARAAKRKTAAGHAGLGKGDVLLSLDGAQVRNASHLQWLIGGHYGGDFVTLRYKRKKTGKIIEVLVQLDERP